jgi:hypothetical protein
VTQLLFSEQITITLNGVDPNIKPCEIWTDQNIDLSIISVDTWDCTGILPGYMVDTDSIWLWPARIHLDLSRLKKTVLSAEVDVKDYCGVGCTQTAFYIDTSNVVDFDSNTVVMLRDTLRLSNPKKEKINIMTVSSYEGAIVEIRLELEDINKIQDFVQYTPDKFTLDQNYPNPFNPVTTISFQLVQPASVNLSIFNLLGIHLQTLINEVKSAGTHSIKWDAKDFESGVYFYKLSIEENSLVRKCVLLE